MDINQIKKINIENYNYYLDENKIAKFPADPRDSSKLLIFKDNIIKEDKFSSISKYLISNSLLVFNNTKVISARLFFNKPTGAKIEILCLEPHNPSNYELAFQVHKTCTWKCIIGNSKKWKTGKLQLKYQLNGLNDILEAEKISEDINNIIIQFNWNLDISFSDLINIVGKIPLPPYLNRDSCKSDKESYQTVYSKYEGSVAAPTAGLHFSDNILNQLYNSNICTDEITLHVGAGTFKPVKSKYIGDHKMHTEHFIINKNTLLNIKKHLGNIIAVGTTTTRCLESIFWLGENIMLGRKQVFFISQWQAYNSECKYNTEEMINTVLNYMENNNLNSLNVATEIIICPGYNFRIIKNIITNFHQPKSTLLLLIAALIGDDWRNVYNYALKNNFRFLSYGDSSILHNSF